MQSQQGKNEKWGGSQAESAEQQNEQRVVIVGFDVNIVRLASDLIKVAVAAVPAAILFLLLMSAFNYFVGGLF